MTKFELSCAANHLVRAYGIVAREYYRRLTGFAVEQVPCRVVKLQTDAPQTLAQLRVCIEHGPLVIASEHSETSIYGLSGNILFRLFHDLGHLWYGLDTTHEDELSLTKLHWGDLREHIPALWREHCQHVFFADTAAQSQHAAERGCFPTDQKAFVKSVASDLLLGNTSSFSQAIEWYYARQKPTVVNTDFMAAEQRLAALYAPEGEDLHAKKAALLFGVPLALVTPEQRRAGKAANFADMYTPSITVPPAALPPVTEAELREFATLVHKHNANLRRYQRARNRLLLAANRFPKKPHFPYGEEAMWPASQ